MSDLNFLTPLVSENKVSGSRGVTLRIGVDLACLDVHVFERRDGEGSVDPNVCSSCIRTMTVKSQVRVRPKPRLPGQTPQTKP